MKMKGEPSMNESLLTIDDVCSELGIGRNTAYKLTRNHEIKSAKIGHRTLVTRNSLNEYIAQKIDNQPSSTP
jgi:excisionase family DNA binding protein